MHHIFHRGFLLTALCLAVVTAALADEPVQKGNAAPVAAEYPATYAGRTFEEWKRLTLKDLDPGTRLQGFSALAVFANNGYEKEAIAAIDAALAKEESYAAFCKGYEALRSMGKTTEAIFVRGLAQPSIPRQRAIEQALQVGCNFAPGEPLISALLEKANNKQLDANLRDQACRAAAIQLMAHAFTAPDPKTSNRQSNPAIEPQVIQVVSALEQLLKDDNPRIGNAAAAGLMSLSVRRPALMATVLDYMDAELTNPRAMPVTEEAMPQPTTLPARTVLRTLANGRVVTEVLGGWNSTGPRYSDLSSEIYQFHRQPDSRQVLLSSLPHLKSLRDRHPNTARYLMTIINELESRPQPGNYSGVSRTFDAPAPIPRAVPAGAGF